MRVSNITVLSAAKFESDPTLELLDSLSIPYNYFEIGIGPLNASSFSSNLDLKNKDVIFIGSCGVFYEDFQKKVVQIESCSWSPPSVRSGQSELIEGVEKDYFFSNISKLPGLETYKCLCSPSITIDESLVPKSGGKLVENLELYSVSEQLKEAKSLHILLGVTNKVWANGRHEWKANFKSIAKLTAKEVEKAITNNTLFK